MLNAGPDHTAVVCVTVDLNAATTGDDFDFNPVFIGDFNLVTSSIPNPVAGIDFNTFADLFLLAAETQACNVAPAVDIVEPLECDDDGYCGDAANFDDIADLFLAAAGLFDDGVATAKNTLAADVVSFACDLSNNVVIEEDDVMIFVPYLAIDSSSFACASNNVIEEDTVMAAPVYKLYQVSEYIEVEGFDTMNIAWP